MMSLVLSYKGSRFLRKCLFTHKLSITETFYILKRIISNITIKTSFYIVRRRTMSYPTPVLFSLSNLITFVKTVILFGCSYIEFCSV